MSVTLHDVVVAAVLIASLVFGSLWLVAVGGPYIGVTESIDAVESVEKESDEVTLHLSRPLADSPYSLVVEGPNGKLGPPTNVSADTLAPVAYLPTYGLNDVRTGEYTVYLVQPDGQKKQIVVLNAEKMPW